MAERGTSAEKRNAKKLIEKLGIDCQKSDKVHAHFRYKNKFEKRLVKQIIGYVLDTRMYDTYSMKEKRNVVIIYVTDNQKEEIGFIYSVLKRELSNELECTHRAFIQSNKLFPPSEKGDSDELTAEDIRMLERAKTIGKTNIRKQITSI